MARLDLNSNLPGDVHDSSKPTTQVEMFRDTPPF